MKWIYGAVMSVADTVMYSYLVNPKKIIAVDLNRRLMIIDGLNDALKYNTEDEDIILKLIGGDLEDDNVS